MKALSPTAWLAVAALVVGCTGATGPAPAGPLDVSARSVEISPATLRGLRLERSVQLTADHPQFGGFSGLLVDGALLLSVTDQGWRLSAKLDRGNRLRLRDVVFEPLPGQDDDGGKAEGDAESLARLDGAVAIGFERDHRIEILEGNRVTQQIRGKFGGTANNGIEALATLPNGALLALRERAWKGLTPTFVVQSDGAIEMQLLSLPGDEQVTGADIGPDGRLYLLRREASLLKGINIRIERYRLAEDGFPRPDTREVLASFGSASGIDNMEGISTWRDLDGTTRLMLVSDDNFNWFQRTLLMEFIVE